MRGRELAKDASGSAHVGNDHLGVEYLVESIEWACKPRLLNNRAAPDAKIEALEIQQRDVSGAQAFQRQDVKVTMRVVVSISRSIPAEIEWFTVHVQCRGLIHWLVVCPPNHEEIAGLPLRST